MAAPQIEFYFDFISPYAYLAYRRLPELGSAFALTFRPLVFAGLLDHWGQLGPAEIPPKRDFVFKDCLRMARRAGFPFRPPAHHPFNPVSALRLCLPSVAGEAQGRVIETLFNAGWGDGRDLGSQSELAAVLSDAGLDGAALIAETRRPEVKRELFQNAERALAAGVFGVPTLVVGDELFWGSDQLVSVREFLEGRDPALGVDVRALLERTPSAERRRS